MGSEIIASSIVLKLSLSYFFLHDLEEEEFGEFGQRVFIGMQ